MPEDQEQIIGEQIRQAPPPVFEGSSESSHPPAPHLWTHVILVLTGVLLGLGFWVWIQYERNIPVSVTQVHEDLPVSDAPVGISVGTSSKVSSFVDADGRFSLEYPSGFTPQVSRDIAYQEDSVYFKSGTTTALSLHVRRANARWPDLQVYLNDQILMSKGGGDVPKNIFTSPSGIEFIDVGKRQFLGHVFFAQMSPTEFLEFSFYDEMYVAPILSSIVFSKPTVVPNSALYIPEGWNVLKSTEYGFEIRYPSDYVVAKKESDGVVLPNAWKISQLGELPKGHYPKTVTVEVIDPKTIRANRLDGTYMKYDAERGVCYNESIRDSTREYLDGTINGYVACRWSVGDAGSFGSAVYIIYPGKEHALKVSTTKDEYQERAPLDDIVNTVSLQ